MTDQTTPEAIAAQFPGLGTYYHAQIQAAITAAVEKAVEGERECKQLQAEFNEYVDHVSELLKRLNVGNPQVACEVVDILVGRSKEVERLQADLAAAEGRAQEYQTAAEEYERLYADALTTLETARAAGVAEGREKEREDLVRHFEQQAASAEEAQNYSYAEPERTIAAAIRARTGKEQP